MFNTFLSKMSPSHYTLSFAPIARHRIKLLAYALLFIGCSEKIFYLEAPEFHDAISKPGPEPPLELLWERKIDGPPLGGALFAGSLVLQLTTLSTLHAFDRYSGLALGKKKCGDAVCSAGSLAGELYLLGDLSDKAGLRALDRKTMQERWRHQGVFCLAPEVRGDTLLAIDEEGTLDALERSEGRLLWQLDLGSKVRVGPSLSQDLVFVGTVKGDLIALELNSGAERWRLELGESSRSRPLLAEDRLFVSTASGRVIAVSIDSGRVVWEQSLGGLPTEELALGSGVLVVGCVDRNIYGLDPETGVIEWTFTTGGVVRSSPQVTSQTVYCASSDNYLYALELASGHLLWKYRLNGPILAPVTVADGLVSVATEERTLYVFGHR